MTATAYLRGGQIIGTAHGCDEMDCFEKIERHPEVARLAAIGPINIRIEDEHGDGCWMFVGPPPEKA